jgi:hypothetical protein
MCSHRSGRRIGLDEHKTPVLCGMLGGLFVGLLGAALPPTLFWGEFEIKSIADVHLPLAHIWPQVGTLQLLHWCATVHQCAKAVKLSRLVRME